MYTMRKRKSTLEVIKKEEEEKMKKEYKKAEIEVVEIEAGDIITTSSDETPILIDDGE